MKKLIYLLLASAITLASCKKDKNNNTTPPPTPETPTAKIIFVNGALNSGPLAIKINDTSLAAVSNIDFLANSGYVKTSYGNGTKVAFVYPGSGTLFDDTTVNLSANNSYSAFVAGELPNNISLLFMNDNLTAPASGKAKVRLANLSADDYHLDFYVGGPKLEADVQYKEVTPFYEVTAGSLNVIAQDPDSVGYQRTLTGQAFESGKIYTVIFTGKTNSTGNADLKLSVINNN
jgi:hypothetical protein